MHLINVFHYLFSLSLPLKRVQSRSVCKIELQEKARREEALARLERLGEKVRAGNRDLTEEQADSLADRFSREVIGEMADEGKTSYRSQ